MSAAPSGGATATVGAFFEAINDGNVDEAVGLLAEDVRWSRPPDVPVTGTLEGVEAVRKMWRAFSASLREYAIEPAALREGGGEVLAEVTFRLVAEDGRAVAFSGSQVFTVRDDRIAAVREFRTIAEGESALSGPPPSR